VRPVRRRSLDLLLTLAIVTSGAGCGRDSGRMHSVGDVRATFARHGLPLSVMQRNRVSTTLLPSPFVRALRRTPALGTPPRAPNYQIVVFTNRRWLRDLSRHEREAQATLGGRPTRLVSDRHDNVFVYYLGGPSPRERLKKILDDV
jgi:hypothetical protein